MENKRGKWHFCCAVLRYISYTKFSQILEVLRDFYFLFGSRNSPTTGILHAIRHVYRSVWPEKQRRGTQFQPNFPPKNSCLGMNCFPLMASRIQEKYIKKSCDFHIFRVTVFIGIGWGKSWSSQGYRFRDFSGKMSPCDPAPVPSDTARQKSPNTFAHPVNFSNKCVGHG